MFDHLIWILSASGAKVPIFSDILAWWVTADGCVAELMRAIQKGHSADRQWNRWHFFTFSWINTQLEQWDTGWTLELHKTNVTEMSSHQRLCVFVCFVLGGFGHLCLQLVSAATNTYILSPCKVKMLPINTSSCVSEYRFCKLLSFCKRCKICLYGL